MFKSIFKEEKKFSMECQIKRAIVGANFNPPCAEEIVPMIKAFGEKALNAKVKWDGTGVCWYIESIVEILPYLAGNTRNYEKLKEEEIASLRKIFDELESLLVEAIERNSQSMYNDDLSYKIEFIREIFYRNGMLMRNSAEEHSNLRDGMIFQNYENLWNIIHRLNTEWDELYHRVLNPSAIEVFFSAFIYERNAGMELTEEEKFANFMALLDGKMKAEPVHRFEYIDLCSYNKGKLVPMGKQHLEVHWGFKIVPNNPEIEVIHISATGI